MAPPKPALPDECLAVRLSAGTQLFRVHRSNYSPIWFGPAPGAIPANRFDAPSGQYRTLYAAEGLTGAFAETLLRKAARIIAWPFVEKHAWSLLELQVDIDLAQLHGKGLAWHGVTGDICAGDDYGPPQALASAFHDKGFHGIAYRSRHNNDEVCYALFDRLAPSHLKVVKTFGFAEAPQIADDLVKMHAAVWEPMLPLKPLSKLP